MAGALSLTPWFGKPTYALITAAQVVALLADDVTWTHRRRALVAFAVGGAVAAAVAVGFVALRGDLRGYARIQLVDIPAMYRFIWARTLPETLSLPWAAAPALGSAVGAGVLLGLIYLGELPRRVVAIALLPLCALAGVVVQAKGFPYHCHPVTAGVHLQWLALVAWITERASQRATAPWRLMSPGVRLFFARLAPLGLGGSLALRTLVAAKDSPHLRPGALASNPNEQERTTRAYFDHFPELDFFPFEMRQTAAYIRDRTTPDDQMGAPFQSQRTMILRKEVLRRLRARLARAAGQAVPTPHRPVWLEPRTHLAICRLRARLALAAGQASPFRQATQGEAETLAASEIQPARFGATETGPAWLKSNGSAKLASPARHGRLVAAIAMTSAMAVIGGVGAYALRVRAPPRAAAGASQPLAPSSASAGDDRSVGPLPVALESIPSEIVSSTDRVDAGARSVQPERQPRGPAKQHPGPANGPAPLSPARPEMAPVPARAEDLVRGSVFERRQ